MNITRLEIEGFRSYGEKQTIDFQPNALYLLTGENRDRGISSAAGKSSILKAITTVLFEENDDDSIRDHAINTTQPERGCRIALSFTNDTGVHYYVVYARQHQEEGTHWTLFRWTGTEWDAERGSRITDTKALIYRVIHMTYDQFINQAYIPQHKIADFIGRTDKDRKAIFGNLLGLDACDKYQKAAADWRKELVSENLRLEGALGQVRARVAGIDLPALKREQDELTATLVTLRETQTEQVAKLEALEQEAEKLSAIGELLAKRDLHEKRYDVLRDKVAKMSHVIDSAEALSKLTELESQKDDLNQRLGETERNVRHAEDKLRRLQSLGDVCDSCERPVSSAIRKDMVRRYTVSRDGNRADVVEMRDALIRTKTAWEHARDEYNNTLRANIERQTCFANLSLESEALNAVNVQLDELRETIGDGIEIPRTIADERRALLMEKTSTDTEIFESAQRLSVVTERLGQYVEDQRRESSLVQQQETVAASLTGVKRCEELVGEKGFKSYKIHSSRDTFNNSLGKHLSVLTDGEVQATLVTEVPKADGRGVKAELDILVRDGDKAGVPIRQYSGGEKAFLSLGITGAFGDLANEQSEGGVNLLLLDEPFANMDAWQEEQACKLLAKFAADGRIVIVVTNHQGVKDRGQFDTELRAVKENHVTHVEEYDLSGDH